MRTAQIWAAAAAFVATTNAMTVTFYDDSDCRDVSETWTSELPTCHDGGVWYSLKITKDEGVSRLPYHKLRVYSTDVDGCDKDKADLYMELSDDDTACHQISFSGAQLPGATHAELSL